MFVLNHHDHDPLYVQLYKQIRAHVLSGKLPANSKLPSVRELCSELSTSRNTVESSYQELYAEGYIYSKPRSGFYVSCLDKDVAPLSLSHTPRSPTARLDCPEEYRYDFHPAKLDPGSFPALLWRRLFLEALGESSRQLVEYRDLQGEWGLRCAITSYLERSRGVVCEPEQIVICAGLQHSLDIVAHIVKPRHSAVAVEDPGYPLPGAVFRNHGFEVIPVPVGPSGMDIDTLSTSNCSVAYVTPSHQYPLGCVMPIAKRLKLIEWAESKGRIIIEDDYDSELRYHGRPIPSLQGLRPTGDIIYLGTFSKVLSPALRVSYMVLPQSLVTTYRRLFRHHLPAVSSLEQSTLTKFMEQGHWDRHVRRMRTIYKKKHDYLIGAVDRVFGPRAAILGQGAGLHLVLQLANSALSETQLIDRVLGKGIRLLPFSETCAGGTSESPKILLGFGGLTVEQIEQGLELLVEAWY